MTAASRAKRTTRPQAEGARRRFESINAYLAAQPAPVRRALEALRRTIQTAAPDAEESISYGMPAFRLHGRPLVAFGAAAEHCAFYPMNPAVIEAHRQLLEAFDTSKGTIRFTVDRPLSMRVVRVFVKARLEDLARGQHADTKRRRTDQPARLAVENVNHPGSSRLVDAARYQAMRRMILKVLPSRPPGVTLADTLSSVLPLLPNALFPDGLHAGWWLKTVQLDLEAKRIIVRHGTPLRLHRS